MLLLKLCLNILAIRAPVAVEYDGGGVYFGGGSSAGGNSVVPLVVVVAGGIAVGCAGFSLEFGFEPVEGRYKLAIL